MSIDRPEDADGTDRSALRRANIRRFVQGDYAPAVLLVAVMIALGAFIFAQNDRYLGAFNISSMLLLVTALGFIALGPDDRTAHRGHRPVGRARWSGSSSSSARSSSSTSRPSASILLGFAAMLGVSISSVSSTGR